MSIPAKKEGLLLYNFISFLHLSVWSKKDIAEFNLQMQQNSD